MNNTPLPLAITLMDFDKFMLSLTDVGAVLFFFLSLLSAHYKDRQATRPKMDADFVAKPREECIRLNAQPFCYVPLPSLVGLNHNEGVESL